MVSSGLLLFDYDANSASPLTNKGSFGSGGDLLDDTGGCAIGTVVGAFNGKKCYNPQAASGGYLRTALLSFPENISVVAGVNPPCHMLVVGQFAGTPSINLVLAGASSNIGYQDSTHVNFFAGGSLISAAHTPTVPHLYDVFHHVSHTRFGADGAFVSGTSVNPGTARLVVHNGRIAIGARQNDGALRSTCNVARLMIFRNRIPYAQYSQLIDLINATYALNASKHASYVQPEDETVAAPGFSIGKAIPYIGQSNNSNYSSVAPTNTWSAATAIFTNQATWLSPGADPFDDETNQLDPISIDPVSTNFGHAAPLAKAEATRYASTVCIVPCARSSVSMASWQKSNANGNFLRGYLYGSAIWRMRKILDQGIPLAYVVCLQGETEAQGTQAQRDAWPALAQQLVADMRADLGLPNLAFLFGQVRNSTMSAGFTDMHDNKIPSIASDPNKIYIFDTPLGGPFEGDGVHFQGSALDVIAANIQTVAIAKGL